MLKAVLFDFGGVITTSPFEAFNRYERARGLPLDCIRRINAQNPDDNAWACFESSRISPEEFDTAFAEEARKAGFDIRGRDVIALLGGDLRPRMVEMLKRCKERYRVACLTNNVRSGMGAGMVRDPEKAEAIAAVMQLFDLVLESSKEGLRKPDPRFYRLACERLDIAPTEALFLDDLGVNLKSARALGMRTIKVVSEEQALRDLSAVLREA